MSDIKNRPNPRASTPSSEAAGPNPPSAPEGPKTTRAGKSMQVDKAQKGKQNTAGPTAHSMSETSLSNSLNRLQLGMRALNAEAEAPAMTKVTRLKHRLLRPVIQRLSAPSVFDFAEEMDRARKAYDRLVMVDAKRLPGLSQCLVKGALIIPDKEELNWVRTTFDEHDANRPQYVTDENGKTKLQVAKMDLDIFDAFEASGRLLELVTILSADTLFPVYLKHETIKIESGRAFKSLRSNQLAFRDAGGEAIKIPRTNTFSVRLPTALVFRALCEGNDHVAALIIGAAPALVMKDITGLSFRGNIFSDRALISILKQLPPRDMGTTPPITTPGQAEQALGLCIRHYLKFSASRVSHTGSSPSDQKAV